MTSQLQIHAARRVVEEIKRLTTRVRSAVVDDWSDYGSFSIIVRLRGERFATAGFKPARPLHGFMPFMKRLVEAENGTLERFTAPQPVYSGEGRDRRYEGHDEDCYFLHVRFPDWPDLKPEVKPEFACNADNPNYAGNS